MRILKTLDNTRLYQGFAPVLFVVLFSIVLAGNVMAVSPTPEAIAKWKANGVYDQKVANWKAFKAAGGCAPSTHSPFNRTKMVTRRASGVMVTDTIRVLTILVDFPDYRFTSTQYQGSSLGGVSADSAMFDSLLFSDRNKDSIFNPSGSFTDYYLENSFGQMYAEGDIVGWLTMPNNYSSYVGSDNGLGSGGRNLVSDAIDAASAAGVNFSRYDNDGDLKVEGIIVVHAGPGAEAGAYGIWSHRSSVGTKTRNGVVISDYTLNPEELGGKISTMGVFCHEYGHLLQLPDLYDLGSSGARGLGAWSLMASGNWNRASGGRAGSSPAHMDSWSKDKVGFLTLIRPTNNLEQAAIPQLETDPVAYWLSPAQFANQYWIVENRQRVGFDAALPGAGLLIYHVDLFGSQSNPARYRVALEQADGFRQLNSGTGNNGDAGDPWPGSSNSRSFSTFSKPNSIRNISSIIDTVKSDTTQIGVWDISNADSVMFADLDIAYSRPKIILTDPNAIRFTDNPPGGNGDGTFDQGETISVNFTVKNIGRTAWNSVVHLSSTSTGIQFMQNDIALSTPLTRIFNSVGLVSPLQFFIPLDLPSSVETFTISITTDSANFNSGDGAYLTDFQSAQTVGKPQIIVIDDDSGAVWQKRYADALDRLGMPYDIWEKKTAGSPQVSDLSGFKTVLWMTGSQIPQGSSPIGGTMTTADETALTGFLNGGGNLMLSSATAATQLDSAFMADYLHAVKGPEAFGYIFTGFDTNPVGASKIYEYTSGGITGFQNTLAPINGGEASFFMGTKVNKPDTVGTCGVTYDGAYKTVFQTFAFEFLGDGRLSISHKDSLLARTLDFFNGNLAPPSCCLGSTGNIDCDAGGVVDITDLTVLIDHLFISLSPLCCKAAGNVDGDSAGIVDITDLTLLIDHLFISLGPVAACQ